MISFKNKKYILILALTLFIFAFGKTEAATLYIKPAQTEVSEGNIVNVQIAVNTSGKFINNAESFISFPKDLLEVISLDNRSSVFSLWVENPSFSNSIGQVTFNGGVPNPGFQGGGGNVISIIFKAKKVGTASIIFSDSSVRENDGLGTDILSSTVGSTITIVSSIDAVQPPKSSALSIRSSSHPSQNAWYSKDDVDLSWTLPKNATAVRTLLGAYPNSDPSVYYPSPITAKSIENVEDGTWYFHASYLAGGVWSKTEHYKLKIDTVKPTDLRVEVQESDSEKITLEMRAGDSLSGIDRFTVTANSDQPIVVKSDPNGEASVEVPFSRAGEHTITVTALDKAGNTTSTEINVKADFAAELKIDSYPAKIRVNESIEIFGTAPYPSTNIRLSLKNSNNVVEVYKLKSDSYSKFYLNSRPVSSEGEYVLWVDMLKENEEISFSSQRVKILAENPLLLQIGSYTIGLMKVLIPATILLIIFLLIVLYGWHKFFSLYRKVRKESAEAAKITAKSFDVLIKDITSHIARLRKAGSNRKLTEDEIEFLEQFEEDLEDARKIIDKEIGDISR